MTLHCDSTFDDIFTADFIAFQSHLLARSSHIIKMPQIEREIAELFHQLEGIFNKTSKVDEKVANLLREKIIKLENEKLIEELSEIGFKVHLESSGEVMASKITGKVTQETVKCEFSVTISMMRSKFSAFIPGFDCFLRVLRVREMSGSSTDKESADEETDHVVESEN